MVKVLVGSKSGLALVKKYEPKTYNKPPIVPPEIQPEPKPPIAPPPIPPIQQTPVQEKEAYLVCQRTGHEYHITRAQYSIGAGKNVDILTPDNIYVGRKHATLYKDGSRYYLVDENSKNGTRVNPLQFYSNYVVRE